jgi:hypothetical protein
MLGKPIEESENINKNRVATLGNPVYGVVDDRLPQTVCQLTLAGGFSMMGTMQLP